MYYLGHMGNFPGTACASEKQEQAFPERQNSQDFWFLRIKRYFSSESVCLKYANFST